MHVQSNGGWLGGWLGGRLGGGVAGWPAGRNPPPPWVAHLQNDRGANKHHQRQLSCGFEPSSPSYGQFSVQKRPFLSLFQDDRLENSGRSPLC